MPNFEYMYVHFHEIFHSLDHMTAPNIFPTFSIHFDPIFVKQINSNFIIYPCSEMQGPNSVSWYIV